MAADETYFTQTATGPLAISLSGYVAVLCRNQFRYIFRSHCCIWSIIYCWTSVKGGAHMCFIDMWISNKLTKCIWVPPRNSVIRHFEHDNAIEICGGIIFDFFTGLPHFFPNSYSPVIKINSNDNSCWVIVWCSQASMTSIQIHSWYKSLVSNQQVIT